MPTPKMGTKIIDDHVYQYDKNELTSILEAADFVIKKLDYAPGVTSRHFNMKLAKN
jgi:hypothetical protein